MSAQLEGLWLPRWRSDTEAHIHYVKDIIFSAKSKFQKIDIVELVGYGKCLILDGIHQSCEADEFIYQEAITHPALFVHPKPENVLIIGAGAGNVLREVLKHPTVKEVTMVDIDKVVVESCRKYLGWDKGAFEDPRTQLIIGDGAKYIQETKKSFDCIIVDSTTPKPGSIAYQLYGEVFFTNIHSKLRRGGILCGLQSNANILYINSHRTIREMLKRTFTQVTTYTAYCPFYAISYAFTLSIRDEKKDVLDVSLFEKRVSELGHLLHFYDLETHKHMFNLPKHIRSAISNEGELVSPEKLIKY